MPFAPGTACALCYHENRFDLILGMVKLRTAKESAVKALVKERGEPGIWLRDVPSPKVGVNDVLIRILKTSICGTDVHIWNWDSWARETIPVGITVGHEFVG